MIVVVPKPEHLTSFRDALERGWSPNNVDSETVRRQTLAAIEADSAVFFASLQDESGTLGPIKLPDGTERPRLPQITRWLWDGAFCGAIQLRWRPGSHTLPEHVLGHIGYSVVEWKQRRGYATEALREMLREARARGLERVQITTSETNAASRRVIEKAGGRLEERLTGVMWHEPDDVVRRYLIDLTTD
jgi:predicted acetyltransferase